MLSEGKTHEVRRLLGNAALSQRQISRLVGVSRATVAAIAQGTRPDYSQRERDRAAEDMWYEDSGPLLRCPGCGGKVFMPCRLCRIRRLKQLERERQLGWPTAHQLALAQFFAAILQAHELAPPNPPPQRIAG